MTDLVSKALTESGGYLVSERPDIHRRQRESQLAGTRLNIVRVDALIIGSLTRFGRKTDGESGFVSASKRQVAFAKIDVRLVDAGALRILPGTHRLNIVEGGGQVLIDERFYVADGVNRTFQLK